METTLEQLIADALRLPLEAIVDSLEYHAVPEWDSIAQIGLIVALETRLGIEIEDELVPELTSVRAIRTFVDGRVGR